MGGGKGTGQISAPGLRSPRVATRSLGDRRSSAPTVRTRTSRSYKNWNNYRGYGRKTAESRRRGPRSRAGWYYDRYSRRHHRPYGGYYGGRYGGYYGDYYGGYYNQGCRYGGYRYGSHLYLSFGYPFFRFYFGYPYYYHCYYGSYPYRGYYYPYDCTPYYSPRPIFYTDYAYPLYPYYYGFYYPYAYPYVPAYEGEAAPVSAPARRAQPTDPDVEMINRLIEGEQFEEAALGLFRLGEYDLATEFFKKAIYNDSETASVDLRLRLGIAYFASGEIDLADLALRAGLARGIPDQPVDVWGLYGRPDDFQEQYVALQERIAADPQDLSARFTFAFLALQIGEISQAREGLEQLVSLDADDNVSRALLKTLAP